MPTLSRAVPTLMSRRIPAIAAALSVLVLGAPLLTGCSDFAETIAFGNAKDKYAKGDY